MLKGTKDPELVRQLKELEEEFKQYHIAFTILTEREKSLINLRYERHLNAVAVANLLYLSKTTYYEELHSIELKIHSFFEGMRFKEKPVLNS
ncbi:hypothetical protein [Cellulosilyticum sp. I15G10I2]|uniref:hypothetical protein n=1 Tax=Cellulosilyticum sp. I15G10I2 TaxID=1892843 RepID=UPI00085CA3AC|nr:hypothetical protein [Cellulosilyticum sp. I15G10I2]